MADKQSRLADIYKAEKSKGGGIASTLGKRTLEKMDPRKFFNQKGFMATALPSLFKSYSATPVNSGAKIASAGGGSFSSGVLETKLDSLTGETRELKIHSKIAAKNSESLPLMARDMNLMRQNIAKLVKLQGGTAASRADMFFMKSGEKETAYETRFIKEGGKSKTPTQVGEKPKEEKKGIFASIVDGISSLFSMKGLLIAGILAAITFGIKEYFTNDDFKLKVDSFLGDMFTTIKNYFMEKLPVIIDFMRDHWKELALAFALLFPKTTMDLIAGGLNVLSSGITLLSKAITTIIPLIEVTLVAAFRGLIAVLTGPMGLILLLGGALFAARKLFDQNQEEYLKLAKEKKEKGSLSEKDEARLKELSTPVNREKARQDLKYDPTTGKAVSDEEAKKSKDQVNKDTQASYKRIENDAFIQLANEFEASGKKDPLLNPEKRENVTRRTNELIAQGYIPKPMPVDVKVEGSGAPSVLPNETAGGAAVGLYPTPGMQKTPGLNHGGRTTQKLVGGGVGDERLIKPDTPTPASYSNEGKTRPTTAPSSTGAYRGQRSDTAPTKAPSALDITAASESGGRYDLSFGDAPQKDGTIVNVLGKSKNFPQLAGKIIMTPKDFSGKPLNEMTLAEVKEFQEYKNREAPNTNAVGKYQFMRTTLFGKDGKSGLVGQMKLPMDTIFSPDTQELLQATMREGNAATLKKAGVAITDANLNLANAVGAGGVVKLLKPENANKNALDVLGYARGGDVALSNPQLDKLSKDVVAETYSKYDASGMASGGSGRPPSGPVVASASAPSSTPASSSGLKMPTMGTLAAAAPSMGDMIASATSAFGDITRAFDTAMASVTNITNNNTQSSAAAQQSQGNLPSVYDDVFLNLFQRVT